MPNRDFKRVTRDQTVAKTTNFGGRVQGNKFVFKRVAFGAFVGDALPSQTLFLGLYNGATELSGFGYTRVAFSVGAHSNAAAVTFPAASTPGWTVTHAAVFAAISGGSPLRPPVAAAATVPSGDILIFPIGTVDSDGSFVFV